MKICSGKVPPGGWHYEAAPSVTLTAMTEELLKAAIFEWRMRNNVPIGDIERDLDAYYCSRWPEACVKEPKDYGKEGDGPRREPMLNRVTQWAAQLAMRMPRGGMPLVTPAEADRRSLICTTCPKNVAWKGGCAGCSHTTTNLLMTLRGGRIAAKNGSLMGCSVLGWDNATAVHQEVAVLGTSAELPASCWRKQ